MNTYEYGILQIIDEYGNDVFQWAMTYTNNGFFTSTNTYGGGEKFVDACEVDC